jgi:4-aminobutyrate aminotransferase
MSMGIELKDEKDKELPRKIIYRCYEKGLLIITLARNVLRVQPPLNIDIELLVKGFNIIEESMNDYKNDKIGDNYMKYQSSW